MGEPTLLLMDKCDAEKFYPYMDNVDVLLPRQFKSWLLYEATALNLFEIVIRAKESK